MKNSSFMGFPDFNIPYKKKDAEFHKKVVESIIRDSIHDSYDMSYQAMNECYEFYQGIQSGQEFEFLQKSEDGSNLPAIWINFNKIKTKIDLLLGELSGKGYKIDVKLINKDAVLKKQQKKEEKRVEMRMQKAVRPVEENSGMQFLPEELPQNEQELDYWFNYKFKEKSEIVMKYVLSYIAKKTGWDYTRIALFRDILIAGRCFVKTEIINGMPTPRRIDPRFMVFDSNATNDFLSDSTYFGEVEYVSIAECAERYGVSKKELEDLYNQYRKNQNLLYTTGVDPHKTLLGNTNLKFFKQERGELRVLVFSAVWQDTKKFSYRITKDSHGNEHFKYMSDTVKDKEGVESLNIKIWRKGTLIAGDIIKNWGEIENQVRDIDDLYDTRSPYKAFIPNYLNGHGISKVEQLKGLQKLKDIALYNVQLAMARAGGKGFVYDISQCPDEFGVDTVLMYLKTAGIAFIDSKKDGQQSSYNQFQQIDMGISDSVSRYIEISMMVDREMDAVSGINEARQGTINKASVAVGVTQAALMQSDKSTETLYSMYNMMINHVFNHLAGLLKISWVEKERFAPVIGDAGVDFLKEDIDFELQDHGIFIEETPNIVEDEASFKQIVQAALGASAIDFVSAMKLMREKDIDYGIAQLEKLIKEREEKQMQAQQMQMQQMQQESQAKQQDNMMMLQNEIMKIKAKGEEDMKLEALRAKANIVKDKYFMNR